MNSNIKSTYRYRVCRYCGYEFETPHISKTFCTDSCSDNYYNHFKRKGAPLHHILNPKNYLTVDSEFDFKINKNKLLEKDEIEMNKLILKGFYLKRKEKAAIEKRILDSIGFQIDFFEGIYLTYYPEIKRTTKEFLIGRHYVEVIDADYYLIRKI